MLEKMIAIIEEQLNVEGTEITLESNFKEDLKADSLDLFELVMALEEADTKHLQKLTSRLKTTPNTLIMSMIGKCWHLFAICLMVYRTSTICSIRSIVKDKWIWPKHNGGAYPRLWAMKA